MARDMAHYADPADLTPRDQSTTPASTSKPEDAPATARARARSGLALLPRQGSRHLLAVDTTGFVRRAWHACVNDKKHEPERAAPTALRMLARMLRGRQPSHLVFAGEGYGSAREKLFPGYKAGRPPKPDGLLACESAVWAALATADTPRMTAAGLEADDVVAGAVLNAKEWRMPVVVASHDADVEQLVDDLAEVTVWDGDGRVLDEAAVLARWGVAPRRLGELFALAGQDGDGIPGVHGWGPKIAAKILAATARHSLPDLVAQPHLAAVWVPAKYRGKFAENVQAIAMSYELARLRSEQFVGRFSMEDFAVDGRGLIAAESLRDSADRIEEQGRERDGGEW